MSPAPKRVDRQADREEHGVVLGVERRDGEKPIRDEGPRTLDHRPSSATLRPASIVHRPVRRGQDPRAEQRDQPVHADFLAVVDMQRVDDKQKCREQRSPPSEHLMCCQIE